MSLQIKPDSIATKLTQTTLDAAMASAKDSAAKYQALVRMSKAPYCNNDVSRHFIGKVGEYGSSQVFEQLQSVFGQQLTIDNVFKDESRDSECDLIVNGLRVEIKTWKPWAFNTYGPCISDRQAKKLNKKCEVVVYAVYDQDTKHFALRGWNYTKDIDGVKAKLTGTPGKQVLNRVMTPRAIIQLPVLSHQVA